MDYVIEEKENILVVDDDEITLRLARKALGTKYNVTCAGSGSEAIDIIDREVPDLIITDLDMPNMNGFQMMTAIKKKKNCGGIPFMIMTGNNDSVTEIRGLSFGAEDYIIKPFSYDVMIERVDRVIKSEKKKKRLEQEACEDELTGAGNRRYIEDVIRSECVETKHSGVFMLMDLDNFKAINDTYGHKSGDDALRRFATLLRLYTRGDDAVSRIGGDEFAVFYSGGMSMDLAAARCEEIIKAVKSELGRINDGKMKAEISVSIGVAFAPDDGVSFQELYEKADDALYRVKRHGKGDYCFYSENGDNKPKDRSQDGEWNIKQLSLAMHEDDKTSGAYVVNSDEFKKIFRFLTRSMERDSREAQIALLSLRENDTENCDGFKASRVLEEVVRHSLRRGDVAAKLDQGQYVVILLDTDSDNGKIAADRVRRNWRQKCGAEGFDVVYDVNDIRSAV